MDKLPRLSEIGYWSEIKLEIVKKYAEAYSIILSKQNFLKHIYIDAFAGTGIHISKASKEIVLGSPLNALYVEPPFKELHLIDLDGKKAQYLAERTQDFSNVYVYKGDCNKILGNNIVDSSELAILESECLAVNYDLSTRIGAFLFRENHFRPNGIVGAMTLKLLDAYLDASGKSSSVTDKIITVNGCLSTPAKWQDFDNEWQAALKEFGFKVDPKSGRYVFHTTDFKSGYCKLMPTGLSKIQKQAIYDDLLRTIRKHSIFIVGFAVVLKDYAKFKGEYPFINKHRFGKPGSFISILSIGKSMGWAGQKGYSKSISLMFDRGDEFWGEMYKGFKEFEKTSLNEHLHSLTCGDKAVYSPLQAADVVAWECRKYFQRFANIKIDVTGIKPHRELEMLRYPDSEFQLYRYDDLQRRIFEILPEMNGDIIGFEQKLKQAAEDLDNKHRLKRERRNARKENQK